MHDVTIAILAGGRSRRMGQNKSLVSVQGKPMIEHIIENLAPLKSPMLLITNSAYDYAQYNLTMYADVIPDHGALGGLYTALHHSTTPYVLCVACDMPFLNIDVLRHMLAQRGQADAVAASIEGVWQTFPAVYSTALLPTFRQAIEAQSLQMQRLFRQIDVLAITPQDINHIDPDFRTFTNINTPDELQAAQSEPIESKRM